MGRKKTRVNRVVKGVNVTVTPHRSGSSRGTRTHGSWISGFVERDSSRREADV